MLVADDGATVQYSAPWCGYFESLYGCEIEAETPVDDGMSFKIQ